jgi:hypothetical protein
MPTVTIKGERELMERIRAAEDLILPKLGQVVLNEAQDIIATAQGDVPAETGGLAASFFVSGPKVRKARHSVTATCGYEAPYAAAEHEGFHYGRRIATPPKWLERAASGRIDDFAAKVKSAIQAVLPSAFSK